MNVELEVVDDEGAPCPTGVVGRVRCRSGAVMRGYWHDPERTAEVLGADGWLTTGDLGFLDERDYLTLVGRRSEMYIRGGYNVYPAEVERVLSEHPAVAQVAVLGVPDPVLGEIGSAFVVRRAGLRPPEPARGPPDVLSRSARRLQGARPAGGRRRVPGDAGGQGRQAVRMRPRPMVRFGADAAEPRMACSFEGAMS